MNTNRLSTIKLPHDFIQHLAKGETLKIGMTMLYKMDHVQISSPYVVACPSSVAGYCGGRVDR